MLLCSNCALHKIPLVDLLDLYLWDLVPALLFLLDLLHFEKQQHGEVFKFYKLLQDDFLVHKGHKLDAMSQNMGTTFGTCSIGKVLHFSEFQNPNIG